MKVVKNGNEAQEQIENILTIDLEDWFHANYEEDLFQNDSNTKSTVCKNTEVLLNIFEEAGCKATFFVLGFVAESHPDLINEISRRGHEIASHGYAHKLVYSQTPAEFREDIKKSRQIIENITGKKVLGYRAPSWSITKKSLWALEILTEEGFVYDSSIFPFENFLYGIKGAPRFQYNTDVYNEKSNLLEIPPSTLHTPIMNIPFSGGFYFRVMPTLLINYMTKIVNQESHPALFYLHPREIDPNQPKLKLGFRDALIHYWGIRGCERKLRKVVDINNLCSIQEALKL